VNGRGPGLGAATQRKDGGGAFGPMPVFACRRWGSGAGSGAVEVGTSQRKIGEGWVGVGRCRHVDPMATVPGFNLVQTESINSSMFKFISNNFKLGSIHKGSSQSQKN
jgi:hypothetical protein